MAADAASSSERSSVVIAVLTYQRPGDLAEVVPLLVEQALSVEGSLAYEVDVLVIDNDPAGGGRRLVESMSVEKVRAVVEPRPGIAAARNRALDEAHQADFLVFIDDDERPNDGWLSSLLRMHAATGAAAVAGRVVSQFSGSLEDWIEAGRFFERVSQTNGADIDRAATNNLLLDLGQVRYLGLRFDVRFGLSGGEDTLFTRSLSLAGCRMVWSNEAVVYDLVPADRTTRRWVLQRAVSSGNSASRVEIELSRSCMARLTARVHAVVHGLVRMVGGSGRFLLGLAARSLRHQSRGLRTAARGFGMVAGVFGHIHEEYRRDQTKDSVVRPLKERTAADLTHAAHWAGQFAAVQNSPDGA